MQSQPTETPKANKAREHEMLITGEWMNARSPRTIESIDPYTSKARARLLELDDEDVATP